MALDTASSRVPLSKHVLFQSNDLDCAREMVARKFCRHRLEIKGDRGSFKTRHHHVMGDLLSLNYIEYGADVLIDPGALDHFYLIQIPVAGCASVRNGLHEVDADATTASVLNPQWETRMRWRAGCRKMLLQIKKAPFQAFADRVFDRDLPVDVAFDPRVDLTTPQAARWLTLVRAMFAAVDDPARRFAPDCLTWSLNEQRLIEGFLRLQPSNVSVFGEEAPREALSRQVRRGRDFIRAHADKPITLVDIASAAGCATRTLQLGFQSTFGMTPLAALKAERLRRVRCDLSAAAKDTTIADVAMSWGFNHLGRFSADYRAAFGELPRATVTRSGRQ